MQLLGFWDGLHKGIRLPAPRPAFPDVPMTSVAAMTCGHTRIRGFNSWVSRTPTKCPVTLHTRSPGGNMHTAAPGQEGSPPTSGRDQM